MKHTYGFMHCFIYKYYIFTVWINVCAVGLMSVELFPFQCFPVKQPFLPAAFLHSRMCVYSFCLTLNLFSFANLYCSTLSWVLMRHAWIIVLNLLISIFVISDNGDKFFEFSFLHGKWEMNNFKRNWKSEMDFFHFDMKSYSQSRNISFESNDEFPKVRYLITNGLPFHTTYFCHIKFPDGNPKHNANISFTYTNGSVDKSKR